MKTYGIYFMLNNGQIKLVKLEAINKQIAVKAALVDNNLDDLEVNEIKIREL